MTSEKLVLGLLVGAALIRICPMKMRRWLLLAGSLATISLGGKQALFFLGCTVISTWAGALGMETVRGVSAKEQDAQKRRTAKKQAGTKCKWIAGSILASNFFLLAFLRSAPVLHESGILRVRLFVPLGISFYTFMAMGYLLEVYQEKLPAEHNIFRLALFVSFYPQLLEGPIGRYEALSGQLWEGRSVSLEETEEGLLRICWGLFKKKVLADRAAAAVSVVFDVPDGKSGVLILAGLLLYSFQQYADFSGGIDIVIGASRVMGIRLAENFRQPYFAVSLGDFWRRWHITLGAWMRDFVFYPLALSKPVQRLSKWMSKRLGRKNLKRTMPAALGNLLVFILVGLWHGTGSNYLLWGLYNGIVLGISALLEPAFKRWNDTHAISRSRGFHLFRIVRTFSVVNLGWIFDRTRHGRDAMKLIRTLLSPGQFGSFGEILTLPGLSGAGLWILLAGAGSVFCVSLLQERGGEPYEKLMKCPVPVRWAIPLGLILVTVLFFETGITEGFLYAAF